MTRTKKGQTSSSKKNSSRYLQCWRQPITEWIIHRTNLCVKCMGYSILTSVPPPSHRKQIFHSPLGRTGSADLAQMQKTQKYLLASWEQLKSMPSPLAVTWEVGGKSTGCSQFSNSCFSRRKGGTWAQKTGSTTNTFLISLTFCRTSCSIFLKKYQIISCCLLYNKFTITILIGVIFCFWYFIMLMYNCTSMISTSINRTWKCNHF